MLVSHAQPVTGGAKRPESAGPAANAPSAEEIRRRVAELVPNQLEQVQEGPTTEEAEGKASADEVVKRLKEAAEKTNAYFRRTDTRLQFEVGEQTGRTIIRVIDKQSGEVVRQIPPENLVRLSEQLEELKGLLFETRG